MTYRAFAQLIQRMVRDMGKTFDKPDDDWMPVGFMCDRNSQVQVVGLDQSFFTTEDTKDALNDVVLPEIVREHGATKFAWVSSNWMRVVERTPETEADVEAGRWAEGIRPSQ